MSYTTLAQSAVDWALSKVGCAYSQAKRAQEDIFDCSSLVAIPYLQLHFRVNCPGMTRIIMCHPFSFDRFPRNARPFFPTRRTTRPT